MRRVVVYAMTVITMALGWSMVGTNPAAAALPRCTTYDYVWDFTHTRPIAYGVNNYDSRNVNCENVYGDRTVAVHVLQESLNYCYGPNGQAAHLFSPALELISWQYGPRTRDAVIAVQRYIGVGVDGRAGPTTRSHMLQWDYGYEQCTQVALPVTLWG